MVYKNLIAYHCLGSKSIYCNNTILRKHFDAVDLKG